MATSPDGRVKTYTYISDSGATFNMRLSQAVATAGSFIPGSGSNPNWGNRNGQNKCRVLHGTTADRLHSAVLPMPTVAGMLSKFDSGSFTIGDLTYIITGRTGERVTRAVLA